VDKYDQNVTDEIKKLSKRITELETMLAALLKPLSEVM
jgi:hypothetical protein